MLESPNDCGQKLKDRKRLFVKKRHNHLESGYSQAPKDVIFEGTNARVIRILVSTD
jgi:hypothetical protein